MQKGSTETPRARAIRGEPAGLIYWKKRSLITIWVTMAPVPIMPMVLMLPALVGEIRLVAFVLVVPVGAVFTLIPIVVVAVVRVVVANLDVRFLSRRSHDGTADCKGSRQEQPA